MNNNFTESDSDVIMRDLIDKCLCESSVIYIL